MAPRVAEAGSTVHMDRAPKHIPRRRCCLRCGLVTEAETLIESGLLMILSSKNDIPCCAASQDSRSHKSCSTWFSRPARLVLHLVPLVSRFPWKGAEAKAGLESARAYCEMLGRHCGGVCGPFGNAPHSAFNAPKLSSEHTGHFDPQRRTYACSCTGDV